MSKVVEVTGLTKRYGDRTVVDDVSFGIEAGEVFTLLGPNGAGKTTTVEMLEGLRRPDAGSIRILGLDPTRDGVELHAQVGVMLQEVGAPRALTAREVLALIAGLHADPLPIDEMLERVGMAARARSTVRDLSGGELRRLSLAMALVGRPRLVFLDEPTNGLDVRARRETWETITSLASQGTTVFLTTHVLSEAQSISTRVGILDHGRLIALDTTERLIAGDGGLRFRVDGELDAARLSTALGCPVIADGPRWRLEATPTPELVLSLVTELAESGLLLVELSRGGTSLEEAFLALAGTGETISEER
jgi:ABC-2 type transport system ATP-binding protein